MLRDYEAEARHDWLDEREVVREYRLMDEDEAAYWEEHYENRDPQDDPSDYYGQED
jgi:hypothetical protein